MPRCHGDMMLQLHGQAFLLQWRATARHQALLLEHTQRRSLHR